MALDRTTRAEDDRDMESSFAQALGSDLVLLLFSTAGLVATAAAILADPDARLAGRSSSRAVTPAFSGPGPSARSAKGAPAT